MSLPVGYTVRPMRQEDAALIAELSGAYTNAGMHPDLTSNIWTKTVHR